MMNQKQQIGIIKVVQSIYHEKHIKGFYSGIGFTLMRVIPQNIILFLFYEMIREYLHHSPDIITVKNIDL